MDRKYKNSITDTLNNLVGAGGIKTDVSITVPIQAAAVLSLSVLVAVVAGILIAGAVSRSFKK